MGNTCSACYETSFLDVSWRNPTGLSINRKGNGKIVATYSECVEGYFCDACYKKIRLNCDNKTIDSNNLKQMINNLKQIGT
jgi:hypothetical protein